MVLYIVAFMIYCVTWLWCDYGRDILIDFLNIEDHFIAGAMEFLAGWLIIIICLFVWVERGVL